MKSPILSSETVHTSCVAIGGRAVLIGARSGRGKSDLALRLIDRGPALVSADSTSFRRVTRRLLAGAPQTIEGKMEVRGVGILEYRPCATCGRPLRRPRARGGRLPEAPETRMIAGVAIPCLASARLSRPRRSR